MNRNLNTSSKLFKPKTNKTERVPMEPMYREDQHTNKSKPSAKQLRNPGKSKIHESINNYNVVREKVENEMHSRGAPSSDVTVKKKVSIGL